MKNAESILVEVSGVASRLGCSMSMVRKMEKSGKLVPSMRLETSGRRCWRLSDIEPFMSDRKKAASAA